MLTPRTETDLTAYFPWDDDDRRYDDEADREAYIADDEYLQSISVD